MAAISDSNVSISSTGAIRWEGTFMGATHTVLEFIQWLMDKQDDGMAAGDDLLDITVDTPFDRSTDQIVTLNAPFNIDDTFAWHLYDGSVTQDGGDDIYSGLSVIGPVEDDTEYMILQGGKVVPAYWSTGINAEASPSLVFSRHLVKSREGGGNIDGKRIEVLARELGDQWRRFPVTLGTGNSVAAISNGADIFNEKADATLEGYLGTIVNTEGFQELDIDKTGASGQEFYSKWDDGGQSTNDVYEFSKWISQRSHQTDVTGGTPTGTDFVIENGTIDGQAQMFVPRTTTELLTEIRANVKVAATTGALTGTCYAELYATTGTMGTDAEPVGSLLARSEGVIVSQFTTGYAETIFRFNRFNPATGADQVDGLRLSTGAYAAVFRHDDADATNNLSLHGANSNQDATMNQADSTAASWTPSATDEIYIEVKSSPEIHGVAGEIFQGINVQVGFDNEQGSGIRETEATNDELAIWGSLLTYSGLAGTFLDMEYVYFEDTGSTWVSAGQCLWDNASSGMIVALENASTGVIDANCTVTGITSGASADLDAVTDEELSGGSGFILAKDDNGATGELYIQVVTGVAPVDDNRIFSRADGTPLADYSDATAAITPRTLNPEWIGVSTGSNVIGTYGIGYDPDDVGSSDKFFDLANADRTPPNNVVFTVSGLISGEDRVLVGPRSAGTLDRNMWEVATALDDGIAGTPETVLELQTGTETVPFTAAVINWPDSGIGADNSRLRIERDNGIYSRIPYDSHDSSTGFTLGTPDTGVTQLAVTGNDTFVTTGSFITDGFEPSCVIVTSGFTNAGNNTTFVVDTVTALEMTVTDATGMVTEAAGVDEQIQSTGWEFNDGDSSTDFGNASVGNDVFLAFIDVLANGTSETFTGVHDTTDRDLFVRVRDGGGTPIKTFESDSAEFKSTAQTVAAVRTADA